MGEKSKKQAEPTDAESSEGQNSQREDILKFAKKFPFRKLYQSVVSTIFSLISLDYSAVFLIFSTIHLALSLVFYDNKISLMKGIKRPDEDQQNQSNDIVIDFKTDHDNPTINCIENINWRRSFLLFLANFSLIAARITALSLFSSINDWFIWPACLFHLILTFVWHWNENYSFMDSLRLSSLHIFGYLHPLKTKLDRENHPRISPVWYLPICFIENVILMVFWSQSFLLSSTWNETIFLFLWIVQIVTTMLSSVLFYFLNAA